MGNRSALLEGAIDCLLDKGYAATTARDIAGRAATSLAAIGYHFGSTEGLLNEAIAEGFGRWRERMAVTLEENASADLATLLGAVGKELKTLFDKERSLLLVFFEGLALADRAPEIQRHAAELYRQERAAIAVMVRAVRNETTTAETEAALLQALVDGLIVQAVIGRDEAPDPEAVLGFLGSLVESSDP
jgi:AcrR family transcriptional regulator